MRNSEKIYNSKNRLISTSADFCRFLYPEYTVVGMGVAEPTITVDDDNVHVIENDVDLDVNIEFITNLSELNENVKYSYAILPFNKQLNAFSTTNALTSPLYDYTTNTTTDSINTNELSGEGEYILKVSYQYPACTLIASKLNKTYVADTFNNTLPFGNYDDLKDKYFVVLYRADEPLLDLGVNSSDGNTGDGPASDRLIVRSLVAERGVSSYTVGINTDSDIMVTLNGMILSSDGDYTIEGGVLTFAEPLESTDVVNYIVIGKSTSSTLKTEEFKVQTPIYQGPTNGEGINKYYYNTDTQKYEIYTNYRIKNTESVILTLGGVVLSNKIDYYVSNSNPKRIILEGDLINNDEIKVVYDSGESLDRSVTEGFINVSWYVEREISASNGQFDIEFSSTETFSEILQTETVPYVLGQETYTKKVDLDYPYGTVLYYRVKNTKKYLTITGVELKTENFSDNIKVEIKTNMSNNY